MLPTTVAATTPLVMKAHRLSPPPEEEVEGAGQGTTWVGGGGCGGGCHPYLGLRVIPRRKVSDFIGRRKSQFWNSQCCHLGEEGGEEEGEEEWEEHNSMDLQEAGR